MWRPAQSPRTPRAFRCRCGRPVFFRNSVCLACGTPLGYVPERLVLLPLEAEDGAWKVSGEPDGLRYRNCGNLERAGCNWLLASDEPATLCVACRLNRTIPDLTIEENRVAWRKIEGAKRRLVSQLLALGLPVASRVPGAGGEDLARGMLFDFVRSLPGHHVLTGHADGVITVNIAEADDAVREGNRALLREPYRTLLGHLRHEVGHYYWDRLVAGSDWYEPFRRTFGDEQADYAAALQRNYEQGPPPDWSQRCVSAYASTHPWEDW
ncbi:MAG TPA: putative zinc-binding metallopeptidase, partial [Burkholderiales bacterium]|nr:putative zinc-binding metallopeptidase [Burkholderiales bacterium]